MYTNYVRAEREREREIAKQCEKQKQKMSRKKETTITLSEKFICGRQIRLYKYTPSISPLDNI